MDYKVLIEPNKPFDVCVRIHDKKLMVTVISSTGFKHHILENTPEKPWAVLFTNVKSTTGVLWVSIVDSLVTINGQVGKRIDVDDRLLLEIDATDALLSNMEGYNEVRYF